jgi:hypothetical protein
VIKIQDGDGLSAAWQSNAQREPKEQLQYTITPRQKTPSYLDFPAGAEVRRLHAGPCTNPIHVEAEAHNLEPPCARPVDLAHYESP